MQRVEVVVRQVRLHVETVRRRLPQPFEGVVRVALQRVTAGDVVGRRVLAVAALDRLLERGDRLVVALVPVIGHPAAVPGRAGIVLRGGEHRLAAHRGDAGRRLGPRLRLRAEGRRLHEPGRERRIVGRRGGGHLHGSESGRGRDEGERREPHLPRAERAMLETRVEDGAHALLDLRRTRHRERPALGLAREAADDRDEMRGVIGRPGSRREDEVVGRPLALAAQGRDGRVGERMEPVEGRDGLRRDPGQRVAARHVCELVEHDDAAPVGVPRGRGLREDEHGSEDAGRQRDLRVVAHDERDGAREPERAPGLVDGGRPGRIVERPRAPHEAAHGEEARHDLGQHGRRSERPQEREAREDVGRRDGAAARRRRLHGQRDSGGAHAPEERHGAGASRRVLRKLRGAGLECRAPAWLPLFTF